MKSDISQSPLISTAALARCVGGFLCEALQSAIALINTEALARCLRVPGPVSRFNGFSPNLANGSNSSSLRNTRNRLSARAILVALLLWTVAPVHAALYSFTQSPNAIIPDGNPSGYQNTVTISGLPSQILDINVTLNITGGWNGDLYAYLRHGDSFCVLLNRVGTPSNFGFGYGDTGFHVTLDDAALQAVTIHNYQDAAYALNGSGQLTGTWRPDGGTLSTFNGSDPNGDWTIFFADLSNGSQSTLLSWTLDIQAVPEPIEWALLIFGSLATGAKAVGLIRRMRRAQAEAEG